jgi:hypothetical protein
MQLHVNFNPRMKTVHYWSKRYLEIVCHLFNVRGAFDWFDPTRGFKTNISDAVVFDCFHWVSICKVQNQGILQSNLFLIPPQQLLWWFKLSVLSSNRLSFVCYVFRTGYSYPNAVSASFRAQQVSCHRPRALKWSCAWLIRVMIPGAIGTLKSLSTNSMRSQLRFQCYRHSV